MSDGRHGEVAEIAIFKTKAGVTREGLLGTVDSVSEWLKGRSGFVSRDLTYVATSDTWIELIWWESRDEATAAMEAASTEESLAPMFGAIDLDGMRMLHAERTMPRADGGRPGAVLEVALFQLAAGATREQLLSSAEPVSQWALGQPGFVSRDLTYVPADDTWVDLVWWESLDAANAAMERSMTSESCAPMFSAIDMESSEMLHGERAADPVVADGASVVV